MLNKFPLECRLIIRNRIWHPSVVLRVTMLYMMRLQLRKILKTVGSWQKVLDG
jgi:hypothetical protein